MLLCQDLCRCHHSTLTAIHGRFQKRQHRHDCLSGTHIALYQPVHDQAALHILPYFLQYLFLGSG